MTARVELPVSERTADVHRFDVFGRIVAVTKVRDAWQAWFVGEDGKRRHADFVIPAFIEADELAQYLDDLFHESASPDRVAVVRLKAGG
ncbi:hypothetical protein [Paraburkholderia sp. J94]|uniref:DUF7661 family protein n=1 Tax=Paraburkholderia sp. J94 TaxID=2805441 RepID=UPI002AB23450|nr:hypothetical protein [Paraburkholderia sp. J94]